MNGRDTVTLKAADGERRVRFVGAGGGAGLPPFVGAYEAEEAPGGRMREIRVGLGLNFLWSADAAIDADEAAERIMRTVGLLCVETHLQGKLEADKSGMLQIRDLLAGRYPDYTSVERFVGSSSDPPGRIERMCREDLLRCLTSHAESKGSDSEPTGPGLTVLGFLVWPQKRRFYSAETVRDAVLAWESDGLIETLADRARLRPDRLDDARALLG